MRTASAVAATFGVFFLGATSFAAPPPLPASVAAGLKEVAAECSGVGGRPVTDQAVRQADLNGDGKADFVLFVGWINCEGAASAYGDRAKAVYVYAGDAQGGAASAFAESAYDVRIDGTGTAAKAWLTVSGGLCGQKQAATFAEEKFCERPLAWNGKTRRFDFAPVSTVRMFE
jgi:hypothetical protein